VASIGDGDTFTCSNGARVRLLLIDTPEKGQAPYGERARQALRDLLPAGSTPRLETDVDAQDRYGRVLAYAYTADGRMINEELARQGYALSLTYPPNVRHVERIRSAVQEARAAGRGLHATPAFACTPKDYRAGKCRS
jgi:micrococcal nuclease